MNIDTSALRPLLPNAFGDQNIRLPLAVSNDHVGVVIDADGNEVFTVDTNGERPDEEAASIAVLLVDVVNATAGFPSDDDDDDDPINLQGSGPAQIVTREG